MSKFEIRYKLDRSPDGKTITKIHWHVPGTSKIARKMSLVVQGLDEPIAMYRPTTPDGIIHHIVESEKKKKRLNTLQEQRLYNELHEAVQNGICYKQNCK
jgi:hypothetical protein